ncbi:MAG: energy transducer TonB [Acidobacteriota bacterium]|nr:energy transducer TonB [Acidobacteriota bacterium]
MTFLLAVASLRVAGADRLITGQVQGSAKPPARAVPRLDSIDEQISRSRARIQELFSGSHSARCASEPPRGEFEKTSAYDVRVERWKQDCLERKKRAEREQQSEVLSLPLLGAAVQYDPDAEEFVMELTQADGGVYVSAPAKTRVTVSPEPADWVVCRARVPIADAPGIKSSLRLLLRFRFASPLPQLVGDSWSAQELVVLGVQQRGGADSEVVIEAPLSTCTKNRSEMVAPAEQKARQESAGNAGNVSEVCRGVKVTPPRKIKDVRPEYPQTAQSARIQGTVSVEATVDTSGNVTHARVVRSIPLLDQAALDAVRQWLFTPTYCGSVAVPVTMTVTVGFSLQ